MLHVPAPPADAWRASGCCSGLPAAAARAPLVERPQAQALFAGVAAHAFRPFSAPMSVGDRRHARRPPRTATAGPSPRAARRRSAGAMIVAARASTARSSRPACASTSLDELGVADIVMLDVAPAAAARDRGRPHARAASPRALTALPPRAGDVQGRLRGRGRRAVDARGVAPRRHRPRRRQLRGDRRRRDATSPRAGCPSSRSCSSASSTSPTRRRSDGDVHPLYAYAHVPAGYDGDATAADRGPDRALRPGLPRARSSPGTCAAPPQMEAHNANYVGGDVVTGANDPRQLDLPPARRARPLHHRHRRRLPVLGGDAAGRRRPRHVRLQRRELGAASHETRGP